MEYTQPSAPAGAKSPRYGDKTEQRIVRKLIRSLKAKGFNVHSVAVDRELYILTPTERAAVCEVFEYDAYVSLRFTRGADDSDLFGVLLVQGNGTDIVSDHSYDSEGPEAFATAMSAFYDSIP